MHKGMPLETREGGPQKLQHKRNAKSAAGTGGRRNAEL